MPIIPQLVAELGPMQVFHPGHADQKVHGRKKSGTIPASALTQMAMPRLVLPNILGDSKTKPDRRTARQTTQPAKGHKLTRKAATAMQESMLAGRPWSDDQKLALQEYTEYEYLNMNAALRGVSARAYGQTLTDRDPQGTQERIRNAASAMRPLPETIRVFRNAYSAEGLGLPSSYARSELLGHLRGLLGQRRQEKGFFSSSIKPVKGKAFAQSGITGDVALDITLPAGTPAAYLHSVSTNKSEDEVLVAPGLTVEFDELDETTDPPTLRGRAVAA